jgi:hypothetical protein
MRKNGTARFLKCKQLLDEKKLLLLSYICWLKFECIFNCCLFFQRQCFGQKKLKTAVFQYKCLLKESVYIFVLSTLFWNKLERFVSEKQMQPNLVFYWSGLMKTLRSVILTNIRLGGEVSPIDIWSSLFKKCFS